MSDSSNTWPNAKIVAAWVRDARHGSQRAYATLYRRYLPLVHGILLGRFRPAVADEMTQECFETAFARLDQLHEAERFGPWIAVIARRIRPNRSFQPDAHIETNDLPCAERQPDDSVEAAQLLTSVMALPDAYRETLTLRLVEGMSGPEIAEATGLTPASVRVNLHRGMRKLREALGLTLQGGVHDEP